MRADPPQRRQGARTEPVSEPMLLHHGLVGAALGFPLALLLSGCLNLLLGLGRDPAQYQLVMWSVPPLWVAVISLSFLAPDRRSCWQWLVLANAAAALVLYTAR